MKAIAKITVRKKNILLCAAAAFLMLCVLYGTGKIWNRYLKPAENILLTFTDKDDPSLTGAHSTSSEAPCIFINETPVSISSDLPSDTLDMDMLSIEGHLVIRADQGKVKSIVIDGETLNEEMILENVRIGRNSVIPVTVTYGDDSVRNFEINTYPSCMDDYTVTGESATEGDLYITTYNRIGVNYVLKLNNQGELLFYRKLSGFGFNFKKQTTSSGEIRYTYLEYVGRTFVKNTNFGILCTALVVMDEDYKEIDRVTFMNDDGTWQNLENHDYLYLDDGHYIVASYRPTHVKNIPNTLFGTGNVAACLIEEVKDGQILWSFNSAEHEKLYGESTQEKLDYKCPEFQDYMHINSMILTDDGALLCSFRNIDALLKISRTDGSIIWQFGGKNSDFLLPEGITFAKQHSAVIFSDGSIALYNNGNDKESTDVLIFQLDEATHSVTAFQKLEQNLYASFMGSVRETMLTPHRLLICHGGGTFDAPSIIEYNMDNGETEFTFAFNSNNMLYNANKF